MISMDQAHGWLNTFSTSRLPTHDRNYIQLENEDISQADFKSAAAGLMEDSLNSGDSYRYAEAELFVGRAAFHRGQFSQAYDAILKANTYYGGEGSSNLRDVFRFAVSSWMCGLAEQALLTQGQKQGAAAGDVHRYNTTEHLRQALEIFERDAHHLTEARDEEAFRSRYSYFFSNCLTDFHRQPLEGILTGALRDSLIDAEVGRSLLNKIANGVHFSRREQEEVDGLFDRIALRRLTNWYPDRIREMQVHLAQTIFEPFEWLNIAQLESSTTQIPPYLGDFRSAIFAELQNGSYPLALEICTELVHQAGRNLFSPEYAEAQVIQGFIAFNAGDLLLAVDSLRRAAAAYAPNSHNWAVAFWLLGVVMQMEKNAVAEGLRCWQRAIETFRDLETRAEHAQRRQLTNWYRKLNPILELAFRERSRDRTWLAS